MFSKSSHSHRSVNGLHGNGVGRANRIERLSSFYVLESQGRREVCSNQTSSRKDTSSYRANNDRNTLHKSNTQTTRSNMGVSSTMPASSYKETRRQSYVRPNVHEQEQPQLEHKEQTQLSQLHTHEVTQTEVKEGNVTMIGVNNGKQEETDVKEAKSEQKQEKEEEQHQQQEHLPQENYQEQHEEETPFYEIGNECSVQLESNESIENVLLEHGKNERVHESNKETNTSHNKTNNKIMSNDEYEIANNLDASNEGRLIRHVSSEECVELSDDSRELFANSTSKQIDEREQDNEQTPQQIPPEQLNESEKLSDFKRHLVQIVAPEPTTTRELHLGAATMENVSTPTLIKSAIIPFTNDKSSNNINNKNNKNNKNNNSVNTNNLILASSSLSTLHPLSSITTQLPRERLSDTDKDNENNDNDDSDLIDLDVNMDYHHHFDNNNNNNDISNNDNQNSKHNSSTHDGVRAGKVNSSNRTDHTNIKSSFDVELKRTSTASPSTSSARKMRITELNVEQLQSENNSTEKVSFVASPEEQTSSAGMTPSTNRSPQLAFRNKNVSNAALNVDSILIGSTHLASSRSHNPTHSVTLLDYNERKRRHKMDNASKNTISGNGNCSTNHYQNVQDNKNDVNDAEPCVQLSKTQELRANYNDNVCSTSSQVETDANLTSSNAEDKITSSRLLEQEKHNNKNTHHNNNNSSSSSGGGGGSSNSSHINNVHEKETHANRNVTSAPQPINLSSCQNNEDSNHKIASSPLIQNRRKGSGLSATIISSSCGSSSNRPASHLERRRSSMHSLLGSKVPVASLRVRLSHKAVIGKGSYGIVFQAMDRDTNRIIAVKEISLTNFTVSRREVKEASGTHSTNTQEKDSETMSLVHAAAKAVGLMTSVSSTHGHFTDVTMSMDNGPMKSPVLSFTSRRSNSFKLNSTHSPRSPSPHHPNHNGTNNSNRDYNSNNNNNNNDNNSNNSNININDNNDDDDEVSPVLPPAIQRQLNAVRREIAVLSQLNHRNIVQCYGGDVEDGALRIYMEYVPGGSISSLLKTFGTFEEQQVAIFTEQVLDGLSYLHSKSIIHRDLKCDNLLVDTGGIVKLADFGTAREMHAMTMSTTTIAGTANFIAPEVLKGDSGSVKSDI